MRDAACDTTPWHIWHDAVARLARAQVADVQRYLPEGRLLRAYRAGEPAWMAADEVKLRICQAKIEERGTSEVEALRRATRPR